MKTFLKVIGLSVPATVYLILESMMATMFAPFIFWSIAYVAVSLVRCSTNSTSAHIAIYVTLGLYWLLAVVSLIDNEQAPT